MPISRVAHPSKNVALCLCPVFWPMLAPLGLSFLKGFLEDRAVGVEVFDLNNYFYNACDETLKKAWRVSNNVFLEEKIHSLLQERRRSHYQDMLRRLSCFSIVGFSCFKSNLSMRRALIRELRARNKKIKIVLGGPETARQYFRTRGTFTDEIFSSADYIVVGEGEKPFYDFIRGEHKGKIALFQELRGLADVRPRYDDIGPASYPKRDTMPLLFSRGCVKRCHFCTERLLYQRFRERPVEHVLQDIAEYKRRYKTRFFVFYDSLINGRVDSLALLCARIVARFGSVPWEAQAAIIPGMGGKTLKKMKESGCYNLFVGLESGCDRTLRRMRKGYSRAGAKKFFQQLRDAGLHFGISIIVGYPGETKKDFLESLEFVVANKALIPKIEQVNPFVHYDGIDATRAEPVSRSEALRRHEFFVREITRAGMKVTRAFLGNLVEKHDGI